MMVMLTLVVIIMHFYRRFICSVIHFFKFRFGSLKSVDSLKTCGPSYHLSITFKFASFFHFNVPLNRVSSLNVPVKYINFISKRPLEIV